MAVNTSPLIATTAQAAQALLTSQARIRLLVHEGKLRGVWHGRRLLIPRAALEEYAKGEAA